MRFNGSDYVRSLDDARLGKQYITIFDLMKDSEWRSLSDIEGVTGYPSASISAQLRHMRKKRFGAHVVAKRRAGDPKSGLFEYRLIVNEGSDHEMKIIDRFNGVHRFLSNFFIEPDGTHVEGEYQARKVMPIAYDVEKLTPSKAKAWGKKMRGKERPDWREINLKVMEDLVIQKFTDHDELREMLLATGDAQLIEGNNWHDEFWGICNCPAHGKGENHLGKILMKTREWIRG